MLTLAAIRSTRGLSSPEMRATISPDFRASERPMMSAKLNRFHSSPPGPHHTPPSVRTPSTSRAIALILGTRRSDAPQLMDDWLFALQYTLHAIAHGLLHQPDLTDQFGDPVGFKRCGLVRSPHRAIQRDVTLYYAGPQSHRRHAGRQAGFMPGVAHRDAIPLLQHGDDVQVQLFIVGRIGTAGVQQDQILLAEHFHRTIDFVDPAHAS